MWGKISMWLAILCATGQAAQPMQLLGAVDVPLTSARMEAAGVDEALALRVLDDGGGDRYLRARALSALAALATPAARTRIEAALRSDADPEIRIYAAIALSRRFGAHDVLRSIVDAPKPVARVIRLELATRPDRAPATRRSRAGSTR